MTLSTKVSGTFSGVSPSVKVAGTWQQMKYGFTKVSGTWQKTFTVGGLLDTVGPSSTPAAQYMEPTPDGGFIITSSTARFTSYNGTTVSSYLLKINADYSLDTAFNTNVGAGPSVAPSQLLVQPDGKVLVGTQTAGTYNGTTVSFAYRLNSNGTLDTAFNSNIGTTFQVYSMALQTDGAIILGGGSSRFKRYSSSGVADSAFNSAVGTANNTFILQIKVSPTTGKIYLGGGPTTFIWNGVETGTNLIRLNSDGTRDTAFTTASGVVAGTVRSVFINPDDSIYITGSITSVNGVTRNRTAKLNSNGTLNTSFSGGPSNSSNMYSVAANDSMVIVAGTATTITGVPSSMIWIMDTTGTIPAGFITNLGSGSSGSPGGFTYRDLVTTLSNGNFLVTGLSSYSGTAVTSFAIIGGGKVF